MTLTEVLRGALHSQMTAVTDRAIQASKEAAALYIAMLGVMTLWTGVLEIGHHSELVGQLARRMGPVLTFLFPRLGPDGGARKQVSVNMIANILSLGWATTPAGLEAMRELKKVGEGHGTGDATRQEGTASNEIHTFLIISVSSLQLIPMNVIAYRSQYGNVNPAATVGPTLAATFIGIVITVIFCRIVNQ